MVCSHFLEASPQSRGGFLCLGYVSPGRAFSICKTGRRVRLRVSSIAFEKEGLWLCLMTKLLLLVLLPLHLHFSVLWSKQTGRSGGGEDGRPRPLGAPPLGGPASASAASPGDCWEGRAVAPSVLLSRSQSDFSRAPLGSATARRRRFSVGALRSGRAEGPLARLNPARPLPAPSQERTG